MSVRPADVREHLQRLLTEESVQMGLLYEVLQSESEVLGGDDAAAIDRIGERRHACTTRLTALDEERRGLCRMLSHEAGQTGIEQLLRWCDGSGDLYRQWQANLALARLCKERNDRNGAIVSVKLTHVQKLLASLRGEAPPSTYASSARGIAHFAARELGRA